MNCLCLTLYLSLLLCFGDAWVTITRDQNDYRKELVRCSAHETSSVISQYCTCKKDYNTMMSRQNSTYYCESPFELGCYLSLLQSKQTYLVTKDKETKQIIAPDTTKIDPSDYHVYIWNLRNGDTGNWYDITKEASKYFHVSRNQTTSVSSLTTANLNMGIWKGQLIKITFGTDKVYQKCLTLKVKGTLDYPFKLDDFKERISTHSSTGAPTGTRKPTTFPETTKRKSTMTESTESVEKKSTPTSKSEARISPKKNTKYIIAVPVLVILLAVLVAGAVMVIKRKTKKESVELETGQGEGMKPRTNSNPIITIVNTIEEESTKRVDVCI